ncbi:hypothetical protein [Paenibacillus oryzisoli]|uniref:Uncharacterized protein n=1 Tax=Paenibacillus oryzisoli TaxID=1850517 RepID=A0A198ACD1_9BACL|nr:hypothetical protein [Paenibacillus oryzisoli]OAS18716.1 hypothetical protein A8708_29310 [Paenibacillus oryzisoli]
MKNSANSIILPFLLWCTFTLLLIGGILLPTSITHAATTVTTMPDMPGLSTSSDFAVKVRPVGTSSWTTVKVFSFTNEYKQNMARVTADGPVEVQVTDLVGNISSYQFEPKRYNITPVVNTNTLTFTASPLQKFAISWGTNIHNWLTLVIEPVEVNPPGPNDANVVNIANFVTDNTGATDVYAGIDKAIDYLLSTSGKSIIYFPDGIYRTHSIELNLVDNISFYFSAGSRIVWDENSWGSNIFRVSGSNNVKFYGRGILDGTYRIHGGRGASGLGWWDGINMTHLSGRISNGLVVDGIWFMDTPNSPMRTEGGNNATFYNTKYVNYGGTMNDNIVIYGGSNITFDESIGLAADDSWSAHTGAWGGFTSTYNVSFTNSTYISRADGGSGGIAYGCNEANYEGGDVWGISYKNLSIPQFGQTLDSFNSPLNGKYGNFLFDNVQFTGSSSTTHTAFDHFANLSGTIILNNMVFKDTGGQIAGNPSNKITDLYINNLKMNGNTINSAAQGGFTITDTDNVHWNASYPTFTQPAPVSAPPAIPVYSLPISDNFNNGTLMNWTDLSGSHNNTDHIANVNDPSTSDRSISLNDLEWSGVAGMIKRFTPQGQDKVVTIEMDLKPTANNKISNVYINDRVGSIVGGLRFYNNGKIKYFGTKGSNFEPGIDIMNYNANTWYHLKWVFDVGQMKYDLYIGTGRGVIPSTATLSGIAFKHEIPNIASVRMDTESTWLIYDQQITSFNVDNVAITSANSANSLVNDNASGVTYTGTWSYAPGRIYGDYFDDVHHTTTNNDYVQYTFTGTGVSYITEKNTDQGNVDVYIDGVFQTTVNLNASSRAVRQNVYSKTGLPFGTHTIKLVKTSGTYMLIDAFNIRTNSVPTTANDNASGIAYTGTWAVSSARGLGDYNDDLHYTSTNNDYVEYTFTGTGISYIAEKNSDEGNVDVYIDGVLQTTVNCHASSRLVQQVIYSKTGLSSGSHTIKLIKTSGTYMVVDAFSVTP